MQPLSSVVIRRPFHWGIVVILDPETGDVPDLEPDVPVSATDDGLVALVRHAQDVEIEVWEDEVPFAQAEVSILLHHEQASLDPDRQVRYSGRLSVPSGRLSVGDADEDEVVTAHRGWNQIVVSVPSDTDPTDMSPDAIRIDLYPLQD